MSLRRHALLAATGATALSGCGSTGAAYARPREPARSAPLRETSRRAAASSPIQHVVYIIQENRSFNNLFYDFPGARTQGYGYDENGNKIELHPQSIDTKWDIDHSLEAFVAAYDDGKMDGWNEEFACCHQPADYAYAYVPQSEIKTYWDMASQYVLADNLFQSNLDGSFVAHQYAIAAFANHEADYPQTWWGCEGGGKDDIPTIKPDRRLGRPVPVCEDYTTLGDELDRASIPWRYYTYPYYDDGGLWSAYTAVNHIYNGPDFANDVIAPADQFISDVAGGTLAAVTWITPTYENSDHAGIDTKSGPDWVASLVDAVGESSFWNSTAIFVIWDDWGGWFDPVPPVYEDHDGLGFRVPLIAISAYARQGYVSHVQYESSSVLRFIEDNFGLAQLAASDARAADPASDFFDYSQSPRAFVPFKHASAGTRGTRSVRPPVRGD